MGEILENTYPEANIQEMSTDKCMEADMQEMSTDICKEADMQEMLEKAFDERFPYHVKEKLRAARVAIAGLGGLGSNIAVMLARSGVGHMLLVDYDVVDVTNLNRQMYMIPQIGKAKTEALLEILHQINPFLDYDCRTVKVTEENIHELFSDYAYVCEAFDQADQKAMLVNGLLMECPGTTIISGNGMAGYGDINAIHTTQKMRRLYVCGDEITDIQDGIGLMAPRVAACAAHQANKVIQLILKE